MQGFAKRISWLTIMTTGKVVIIMSPSTPQRLQKGGSIMQFDDLIHVEYNL